MKTIAKWLVVITLVAVGGYAAGVLVKYYQQKKADKAAGVVNTTGTVVADEPAKATVSV